MNKEIYIYEPIPFGDIHRWVVYNKKGAIDLHITHNKELNNCYGGVEKHSHTPFSYSKASPDHTNCMILGGNCWHDGSSLAADIAVELFKAKQLTNEVAWSIAKDFMESWLS